MADRPDVCVVRKTYQGKEGLRVKEGTRFAVGKEKDGLPVLDNARYQALLQQKLVRPLGPQDAKAAPGARPLEPKEIPPTTLTGAGGKLPRARRQAARARLKQDESPPAPKKMGGPSGSPTGEASPSASSPEGQASSSSTSRRRGTRPAVSSSSTTPSR